MKILNYLYLKITFQITKPKLDHSSPGCNHKAEEKLDNKADDFNSTDDRKPSEKSHGATNEAQLGLELDLLVSLDLVEGGRVEEDLDKLQVRLWQLVS